MAYIKYKPSENLKPFVDFYYIWEKDEYLVSPLEISSTANNYCVLLFNYGDRYCLHNRNYNGEVLPNNFLAGQSVTPFRLTLYGSIKMLGVVFKGTAFQDIFSLPEPQSFLDERIDLEALIGWEAVHINEKLGIAPDNSIRIEIIEQFLSNRIKLTRPSPLLIDRAVDIILARKGMVRMDAIANMLNLSPRQFRRCFTKRVGIGPKYFARIKRFNFVNLSLSKNPELKWMEFVDDDGYYDQSHLIKDYIEFSGITPNQFISENPGFHREVIKGAPVLAGS